MILAIIAILIVFIIWRLKTLKATVRIPKRSTPCTIRQMDTKDALDVRDYIVLDVETTGLDPQTERIIEIAAVRYQNGVKTGEYQTFVNPGKAVSAKITELTGITNAQAKAGKQYADMAQELNTFIGNLPMVAHNSKFDASFVDIAFRVGSISRKLVHIDTIPMAREAFPGMRNYKLATLIPALNLATGPQTHRAMDDVLATANLFQLCQKKLTIMDELSREITAIDEAKEAIKSAKNAVDVFLSYNKAEAALTMAANKNQDAALELYGDKIAYLSKAYGPAINDMLRKEFEKEKKAIQRLKTQKAMDAHIASFRIVYENNSERLTKGNVQNLAKYTRELTEIRDMVSPE